MLAPAPQDLEPLEPSERRSRQDPVPATGVRYWFFTCK
jgi:hypothetical protein